MALPDTPPLGGGSGGLATLSRALQDLARIVDELISALRGAPATPQPLEGVHTLGSKLADADDNDAVDARPQKPTTKQQASSDDAPAAATATSVKPGQTKQIGRVNDSRISEISGIAASRRTPGVYWVHNDSGDGPRIFAINQSGKVLGEVSVKGASAHDWEDIDTAKGADGIPYVYVSDIGDNARTRSSVQIYRFAEPSSTNGSVQAKRIDLRYPDGQAHNAESSMVDPRTGDLFIVSKNNGDAKVFRASAALLARGGGVMEQVATVPTETTTTAADISAQGDRLVIKTYTHSYTWDIGKGQSVAQALKAAPRKAPIHSSEAIAFTPDGKGMISISEGRNVGVYQIGTN